MEDGILSEQTTAQAGSPPAAAIVLVDADEQERAALATRLGRRYGAEYDVIATGSGAAGWAGCAAFAMPDATSPSCWRTTTHRTVRGSRS
jgi:hypothetical protein